MRNGTRLIVIAALILLSGNLLAQAEAPATQPVALYDPDPNHLWNRLHTILHVRTAPDGREFGQDTLDPLLWIKSKHLLEGESHQQALAVLDEFLDKHGETLSSDPVKRAILQRDLWAVFDWVANAWDDRHDAQRRALELRLARAIRRVALTREQIEHLPDIYAATIASGRFARAFDPEKPATPFLPPDAFDEAGPWIGISANNEHNLVAPDHAGSFGARSVFHVLFFHPDGRDAAMDYLKRVTKVRPFWVNNPATRGMNPDMPQFPVGAAFMLLRRAILIDRDGKLVHSPLVESIQVRVYRRIAPVNVEKFDDQAFFEFSMSRKALFADPATSLCAVAKGDHAFLSAQFFSDGIDRFEIEKPDIFQGEVLRSCFGCHNMPGVGSVNSFSQSRGGRPPPSQLWQESQGYQFDATVASKKDRYDWGLLEGLWELP